MPYSLNFFNLGYAKGWSQAEIGNGVACPRARGIYPKTVQAVQGSHKGVIDVVWVPYRDPKQPV